MTTKISLTKSPAPLPEKSGQTEILPKDRAYLEGERQKAAIIINGAGVRGIFLDDLARIYTTYFEPRYLLQFSNLDKVAHMLKDLYKRYDEYLAAEQVRNAGNENKAQ